MSNMIKYGYGKLMTPEEVADEVPKGWRVLFLSLVNDLFAMGWDGKLDQVKEKFGGLRFYSGKLTDEMDARLILAENEAERTCVVCGEPGEMYHDGWISPYCPTHMPPPKEPGYWGEEKDGEDATS